MLTIAVDAMGGDNAPSMVLEAVQGALRTYKHVRFIVFGDKDLMSPFLDSFSSKDLDRVEFVFTQEIIGPDVKPSVAVRGFRQSSMYLAIRSVLEGRAQGVISAGNTGAYMALSMLNFKTVADITRPAIATLLPTMKGASVMLDLGANVNCDAENLVQFAVMGSVFAKLTLGVEFPSIGILNIGSEDLKGHEVVREAARILKNSAHLNFYGFVEGDDIAKGTVDVVVTDGFTGNVALKTAEGAVRMFATFTREAFQSSVLSRLGYLLARGPFNQLKKKLDPRMHDGAIFIGLRHVAIKSHGGTDAVGFANAIGVAVKTLRSDLNRLIVDELDQLVFEEEKNPSS